MQSVRNLTVDMLNLDENGKHIVEKLTVDEVVLLVRHKDFPPSYDKQRAVKYIRCREGRGEWVDDVFKRLNTSVYAELQRLDMIREDFYDSEQFRISANIFALKQAVVEKLSRPEDYYFESSEYVPRLVRELDNNAYENWLGFTEKTIQSIKELLRNTLPFVEYQIIRLRFGLDNGECADWDEISQWFGWTLEDDHYFCEKNAIESLYSIAGDLAELTRIRVA